MAIKRFGNIIDHKIKTVKQLYNLQNKGGVIDNSDMQRSLVWTTKQKRELVHSVLLGIDLPPFWIMKKNDSQVLDIRDGKQRKDALFSFIDNKFSLNGMDDIENDDGTITKVDGLRFKDLSEDDKELILGTSLTLWMFDENSITDEQMRILYTRINNGTKMATTEINRINAASRTEIAELSKHPIFDSILSQSSLNHNVQVDYVQKTFVMLTDKEPSLLSSYVGEYCENNLVSDEAMEEITNVFDLLSTFFDMYNNHEDNKLRKIVNQIKKKTAFLSLVPIVKEYLGSHTTDDINDFAQWVFHFFNGEPKESGGVSISEQFNNNFFEASAKPASIKNRVEAEFEDYRNFVLNK